MGQSISVEQLFYQGEYHKLLSLSVDASSWSKKKTGLSFVVGALCFTGRMEEALLIAQPILLGNDMAATVRTRFFLGMGFTRLSEYSKARTYFAANLQATRPGRANRVSRKKSQASKNEPSNSKLQQFLQDRFFIYQGISFYRFFCGRFSAAKRASDVAFEAAFEGEYLYGKALATDIRSHILIGIGETSTGFELRKRAEHFAKLLGNKTLLAAFRVSTMIDRSRLGFKPEQSLAELTEAVATLKPEDNYSRANFLLELARQWTLRGQAQQAGEVLDQVSELIYSHQNRRQEAMLNLRYASLLFCSGEYSRGLSAVRSAKRTLHKGIDRVLESETLGLEWKLLQAQGMQEHAEKVLKQLLKTSNNESHSIHRRIMNRSGLKALPSMNRRGLDPLGDLLDGIKKDPESAQDEILRHGFLQLLYEVLQLDRKKPTLYVDLRIGMLLTLDRGNVTAVQGITALLRRILHALAQGATSKEDIFVKAWGFKYDPLRHDSVIYAAINTLRKLLASQSHWLETLEDGYRIKSGVALFFHQNAPEKVTSAQRTEIFSSELPSLNYRQVEIVRVLAKKKYIDVQQCKSLFSISDITASRDLSYLTSSGYVKRIGKGRATKYSLESAKK